MIAVTLFRLLEPRLEQLLKWTRWAVFLLGFGFLLAMVLKDNLSLDSDVALRGVITCGIASLFLEGVEKLFFAESIVEKERREEQWANRTSLYRAFPARHSWFYIPLIRRIWGYSCMAMAISTTYIILQLGV